jgi:hypothetical protein
MDVVSRKKFFDYKDASAFPNRFFSVVGKNEDSFSRQKLYDALSTTSSTITIRETITCLFLSICLQEHCISVDVLLSSLSDAPLPPRPERGSSQRGLNVFHLRCSCRAREPGLGVLLMIMENDVNPPVRGFLRAPVIKRNTHKLCDTMACSPESAVAMFVKIWSTPLSYAVGLFHRLLLAYSTSLLTCERRTHRMQHFLQCC